MLWHFFLNNRNNYKSLNKDVILFSYIISQQIPTFVLDTLDLNEVHPNFQSLNFQNLNFQCKFWKTLDS